METLKSDLLTAPAAAELLGVTRQWITKLIRDGKLPAQRTSGGWWLIRLDDVEKLKQERER